MMMFKFQTGLIARSLGLVDSRLSWSRNRSVTVSQLRARLSFDLGVWTDLLMFRRLFLFVEAVGDEVLCAEDGDDQTQDQGKNFLSHPSKGDVSRQPLD